ncbi:hypothetical protein D9619_002412 [Psilocybe cf. subviscida]|uniref:F-box domain-containing protein n=1 Tax=Psilocybe cf. subviscida TaxID=2480587 RepID=A0A8H5EUS5_9AGAR|nr:hypothetical protein D9619_002412 [Psilocybe cf. subviscida]
MMFNDTCDPGLDANHRCTSGQPCIHTMEILALEEKIAKLEAQFIAEQKHAHLHNAIHDPLNCFPPEIASAILCYANPHPTEHYYIDSNPIYYLNPGVKVHSRPLELASVCRRWRELALSEPRLWSDVVMRRSSSSWNLSQDLVNQWIARSGALPLVIVLEWEPTEDPVDDEIIALIKHICALSDRWRSIAVRGPSAILPFFHCEAAILLDLEHFTFISTDDDGVGTLSLGQATLRPGTITLAGIWTPPVNVLWTNVTRLDMYRVVANALLGILPELTRLDELRISFIQDVDDTGNVYPEPAAVINLSCLTQMTVNCIQEEHATTFFMHLEAPALRVLTLMRSKDDFEAEAFPLTSIRRLLMKSEGSLRGLSLTGISFFHEDLGALLEPLAALRTLSLTYEQAGVHAMSDQLLTRLATTVARTSAPGFLPDLVLLSYTGPRTFAWGSIALFLEAHKDCDGWSGMPQPSNIRPFSDLHVKIAPQTLPDDFIDKEALLRFMGFPPSWVGADIDRELMDASFQHHGLDRPTFIFRRPWFYNFVDN